MSLANIKEMAIEVPPVSRTACSSITSYRSSDLGAKEIEQFQLESVESCETQRQKDQDIEYRMLSKECALHCLGKKMKPWGG